MKKVIILGAGISGLALAWFLRSTFPHIPILVLEKEAQIGGWIRSQYFQNTICELGPRGFIPKGKGEITLKLSQDLGLQQELISADPSFKIRYLYINGQLQRLPSHPLHFLSSSLIRPFLGTFWKEYRRPIFSEEETIAQFFTRRFSRDFTETFIDPVVSGIFAGDIERLSLSACFPQLKTLEQQHGSITKAFLQQKKIEKPPLLTFRNGMETLPKALFRALNASVEFKLSQTVEALIRTPTHWEVCASKQTFQADILISALPSPSLKNILPEAQMLDIPAHSLALVHLLFDAPVLKHNGFGYLIPSKEKEKILGMTWESQLFGYKERTHLCAMLGGAHFPEVSHLQKKQWVQIAQNAAEKHLGINQIATHTYTHLAHEAIPQYELGHCQNVQRLEHVLESLNPPLFLAGNHFYGVGINDCIHHAHALTHKISQML